MFLWFLKQPLLGQYLENRKRLRVKLGLKEGRWLDHWCQVMSNKIYQINTIFLARLQPSHLGPVDVHGAMQLPPIHKLGHHTIGALLETRLAIPHCRSTCVVLGHPCDPHLHWTICRTGTMQKDFKVAINCIENVNLNSRFNGKEQDQTAQ